MAHWIYFTRPSNGTVHLADFDAVARWRGDELRVVDGRVVGGQAKTLCGQFVNQFIEGDETLAGVAATCETCKRVSRRPA